MDNKRKRCVIEASEQSRERLIDNQEARDSDTTHGRHSETDNVSPTPTKKHEWADDKKPVLWHGSMNATGESQIVQGTPDDNLRVVADEPPLWCVIEASEHSRERLIDNQEARDSKTENVSPTPPKENEWADDKKPVLWHGSMNATGESNGNLQAVADEAPLWCVIEASEPSRVRLIDNQEARDSGTENVSPTTPKENEWAADKKPVLWHGSMNATGESNGNLQAVADEAPLWCVIEASEPSRVRLIDNQEARDSKTENVSPTTPKKLKWADDRKPVLWHGSMNATGESQIVQGTSDGNLRADADEAPLWCVIEASEQSRERLIDIQEATDLEMDNVSPTPCVIEASEPSRERPIDNQEARDSETKNVSPTSPKEHECTVDNTPGGSMNATGESQIVKGTPGGNLRADADETPLCSNVLDKLEAMEVSEEEMEEFLQAAPCHVQRWVKGEVTAEENLGSVQKKKTIKGASVEYKIDITTNVDVAPSSSGIRSKKNRPVLYDGSDSDSEFDDEFDTTLNENTTFTDHKWDASDSEELGEPLLDVINNFEKGVNEEADRLLGTSVNFNWVEGFETFKGKPEQFTGPTPGALKDYDSAYEAFIDIWDEDIMHRIALETNRYAEQTIHNSKNKGELKPSSRVHDWADTNADELLVLFGVFMYMAIDPRTTLAEYWRLGVLGMPIFRTLMAFNRYILLNKFLHFANNADLNHNIAKDEEGEIYSTKFSKRLFKLQPILEHLGKKFASLYNLGRNISIDESLTLFKGRLSWVQIIRSKAARFGIKSYELCESQTGYMTRFQIYTGKSDTSHITDPSLSANLGSKSVQVVLELLQGLEGRGHCVTMDNFYNSPSLARYLKYLGFDCLGTLRINSRNMPEDIKKVPQNVPKGTMISRQCGDVSIVCWKDCKLVNIISTYHDDSTYVSSKSGKDISKPVSVKDYNQTMGGIDIKDQKLSMYLLERKRGVKWYIKMFKRFLNVSIHNAFVMYVSSLKRRNKRTVSHREFRYELAYALIEKHRSSLLKITESTGQLMRLRRDVVHVPKYECGRNARKRCAICFRVGINKMVHSQCSTCEVFLCFEKCWAKWHSVKDLKDKKTPKKKA